MSDYTAEREAARQIESQRPDWMIVWGVYSKEYVAFPLFRYGSGIVVTSPSTSALVTQMREIEGRADNARRARKRNT